MYSFYDMGMIIGGLVRRLILLAVVACRAGLPIGSTTSSLLAVPSLILMVGSLRVPVVISIISIVAITIVGIPIVVVEKIFKNQLF